MSQLLTILFSIVFAWQQSWAIKAFRDYVPINNPYMGKYHKAGWLVMICFVLYPPIGLLTLIKGLWIWLVFDIALNKFTGEQWDYIGETAWLDRKLNALFPYGDGGEAKAFWLIGLILILNLAHYGKYAG